ncbi:hypothetical protein MVLG_05153 [Microbotryum lychnidis-dioicae p1A1 Lamole]|uniref:Rrp15p-domain-containing protein n=1 Tax=Microbotryum lychnidis-dioicae (strain p1A1 Lamole / MvSl-1064) TaxID=683840 RepID=U5HDD8_USTV1|nr:hypothetical protein MVLG_05153 [Microbotryum lychnidis-dioicae p1A1 Lamole]|eukprot:KDE04439.1 hypothetical protein MVLG_05153 [Microbotryum lychnidis-dioicae p1A1 Lamole]
MAPKSILKQRTVSGHSASASASPKRTIVVPSTSTSQARPARASHRADNGRIQDGLNAGRNTIVGTDGEEKVDDDDDDVVYGDRDDDEEEEDEDEDENDGDEDLDESQALGESSRGSNGGTRSKSVKKLKNPTLKPTPAPAFSQALNHLLSLPPTTASLAPKVAPPSAHAQRLDRKARSVLRESKAQHLAQGHVPDVIAGWGARPPLPFSLWESSQARDFEHARRGGDSSLSEVVESGAEREKRLRKLAQRGVVRLFNAIGAAQGVPDRLDREDVKRRRTIESVATGLPRIGNGPLGGTIARQPNVLGGRGKAEALSNLSKQSFLDLVRAGTT